MDQALEVRGKISRNSLNGLAIRHEGEVSGFDLNLLVVAVEIPGHLTYPIDGGHPKLDW